MTAPAFDKLLATAEGADKVDLTMAHNGVVVAAKAYRDKPGKQTKGDYDAARSMLEQTTARVAAKYFPEQAGQESERFKNRKAAFAWLRGEGCKVSQGKFYQDCLAGNPAVHPDGSVSRYQVVLYAQRLNQERRPAGEALDRAAEKERLEIRKLELDIEKREIENRQLDDQWLQKEDAWAVVAALIGTLLDNLRHQFYAGQGRLIHLAAGDPGRGAELYEGCEELLNRAFNDTAARELSGAFETITDEEDHDERTTETA